MVQPADALVLQEHVLQGLQEAVLAADALFLRGHVLQGLLGAVLAADALVLRGRVLQGLREEANCPRQARCLQRMGKRSADATEHRVEEDYIVGVEADYSG